MVADGQIYVFELMTAFQLKSGADPLLARGAVDAIETRSIICEDICVFERVVCEAFARWTADSNEQICPTSLRRKTIIAHVGEI